MGVGDVVVRGGLAAGVLLGLAALGARRAADAVRATPDRWSYPRLRRDPQGETVWVDRPDGTRVRCVVAGEGPVCNCGRGSLASWARTPAPRSSAGVPHDVVDRDSGTTVATCSCSSSGTS